MLRDLCKLTQNKKEDVDKLSGVRDIYNMLFKNVKTESAFFGAMPFPYERIRVEPAEDETDYMRIFSGLSRE